MALETGSRIQDLVDTNPVGATDFVSQGDDHLRLVKACVKGSFPALGSGQVLASAEELSILDGATLSTAELNILDGVTLTAAQINDAARKSVANTFALSQTFSQPLLAPNGSVGAPAYSFSNDPNTGIYGTGSDVLVVSVGGTQTLVSSAALTYLAAGVLNVPDGAVGAPSIAFNGDPDTGIYRNNTNSMTFVTGGAFALKLNDSQQVLVNDGSAATPMYTFNGDTDTGFYRGASGDLRFSSNGTLSWIIRGDGAFFFDGTSANPGLSFINDPDTGLYRIGSNAFEAVAGAVRSMQWNNTEVIPLVVMQSNVSGTAGAPSYSFKGDPDTGLYNIAADQLGFTEGGAGYRVGIRNIPQNSQSANYTCVATDSGKHILHPSGGGAGDTFTIPANASVAYDLGTAITFVNRDSNAVSIAITSDTMILAGSTTTGTRTLAQNGIATAIKVESTTWIISGTGLS